jgi:TonB-linked SusC/RagA family outer membrane protein
MRKIILFFLLIILVPVCLFAQQGKKVSGTVTDVSGSLPGAIIAEKGMPKNITAANTFGKFTLTLKGNTNTIIVRFVGYATQEIPLGTKSEVTVIMQPSSNDMNEVTVVGFQPSKRITSTGAVSTINASEINTVPTSSVQNTLAGRLPGFTAVQTSGQPGNDASTFYIRGQSSLNTSNQPLILVDDIEYDYDQLQQINVNEIETISLLKDAAETAIYGIKGANGVLLVTTKRGKAGSPKFDLRVEGGLQTPTITPKFLDSYQSAQLVDQAEENGGTPADSVTFNSADLTAFKTGSDPYGHPNTNWYNDIMRKFTYQANTNLDISGGTDQVKYFISFGAFNQNGDLKNFPDPQELVNTNYYYTRYDFRSNLDLRANKTLTLRLDVTTRFGDINAPGTAASATNVLYNFQVEEPFSAPFLNPNGSYAYNNSVFTTSHTPTLNALLANGGYTHTHNTDYNVLVSATQNLDAITPGLSLTGRVAYASSESDNKGTNFLQLSLASETSSFPTYYYNPVNNSYTKNPLAPYVYSTYSYYGGINAYSNTTDVQLFSNYDRTFGDNHFTGLLLINQDSQVQESSIPNNLRGFSLRAGYDFKQKYLIDYNMAYNGTNAFGSGHQYGLFPAVGLGYVLSKEDYFKDLFGKTFDLFKLRASYGIVGSDLVPSSGYIFQQVYNQTAGVYTFGSNPATTYNGVTEGPLANPYITWERSRKFDLGLDVNMFGDKMNATIDYFREYRFDEFVIPQGIPAELGISPPYINSGRVQNRGFDGQIGYHGSIGAVQYNTNFVFSYAKNKILYEAQAAPAYPSLSPIGLPIGQPFGYHFLGYYSQADIAAVTAYIDKHGNNAGDPIAVPTYADSPTGVKQLIAGDLKYQDINGGDGVINVYDQTHIGNPDIPSTTLGLTLGASYKGFSISVLFQGSFDYSYIITGTGIEPFESEFQPIDQKAWTPATAATAQFPILTTNFSSTVNSPTTYPSDYWYVNAYYVRLKSLDVGYQLPTKILPFHLRNARIYLSAYNLFTWDNFSRYQQDPEVQSGSVGDAYINQRVVNLGLQLGF